MQVSAARRAAFDVLRGVAAGGHADDVLHGHALQALEPRDAALATALVMSVLRWQRVLDAAWRAKVRDASRTPEAATLALRVGLAQLWLMDRIPPHAALSESVELVKLSGEPQAAAMVNAVLRALQRGGRPRLSALDAQAPWMLERWRVNFGDDAALRVAEANQREPQRAVRASGSGAALAPAAYLSRAFFATAPQSNEDGVRVQDEGSQLVAELAAHAASNAKCVLDACAAPGGKTAVLAELLPAARIVAVDLSAARLRTMQRLLPEALRERVETVQSDAGELPPDGPLAGPFDLALVDAPCSGTGTLARNPEIKLRLSESDLARQAQRQMRILRSVWQRVGPGGTVVYSTCSLEPEENATVIDQFSRSAPEAKIIPAAEVLQRMQTDGALRNGALAVLLATALRGDFLQTLPGVHSCDGFFAAILRKRM